MKWNSIFLRKILNLNLVNKNKNLTKIGRLKLIINFPMITHINNIVLKKWFSIEYEDSIWVESQRGLVCGVAKMLSLSNPMKSGGEKNKEK